MKIGVIGSGYVGLTSAACLANLGNDVLCMDIDSGKVARLKRGVIPIFEPGLSEMVLMNVKERRLSFTTNLKETVDKCQLLFICVGTPSAENGEADLSAVYSVAKDIARAMKEYRLVIVKSTVPPGTNDRVAAIMRENLKPDVEFDTASNPEFLREGEAINDFLIPDRIVIGVNSSRAQEMLTSLYKSIERSGRPIVVTDIRSCELIKYASNAMLALRISFMNELAGLCDVMKADIKQVAKGMGLDNRIGPRFLHAGIGYGGSCFPKDVKALISLMDEQGCMAQILTATDSVNNRQKLVVIPKLKAFLGELKGKNIAVWGLAFKPKTDDMRDAPALIIINELMKSGAKVAAFDPVAKPVMNGVAFAKNPYDALKGADALIIATEWDEFRQPDFKRMKSLMKRPLIVDGRNIYEPAEVRQHGFEYAGIGR